MIRVLLGWQNISSSANGSSEKGRGIIATRQTVEEVPIVPTITIQHDDSEYENGGPSTASMISVSSAQPIPFDTAVQQFASKQLSAVPVDGTEIESVASPHSVESAVPCSPSAQFTTLYKDTEIVKPAFASLRIMRILLALSATWAALVLASQLVPIEHQQTSIASQPEYNIHLPIVTPHNELILFEDTSDMVNDCSQVALYAKMDMELFETTEATKKNVIEWQSSPLNFFGKR